MAFEAEKMPHEGADIGYRAVLRLVLVFLAFVACLMALLGWFYHSQVRSGSLATRLRPFPAPQLEPNPRQDYLDFRKGQREQLAGTRWTDATKTLIHVPIERAMAYVVGRGAAAYEPLQSIDRAPSTAPPQGQNHGILNAPVAPYGSRP